MKNNCVSQQLLLIETKLNVVVVLVTIRSFHGITRKAFQGPTYGRVWCDTVYFLVEAVPWDSNAPSPYVLPWKKAQLSFQQR